MTYRERILQINQKLTVEQWSEVLGISKHNVRVTFYHNHKHVGHLMIKKKFKAAVNTIRDQIKADGGTRTSKEWARLLKCKPSDVRNSLTKYPGLKPHVKKERVRPYRKAPQEWSQQMIESGEKLTLPEWAGKLGCKVDQIRPYVNHRPYLRDYVVFIRCKKDHITTRVLEVADQLPMRKTDLCGILGVNIATLNRHEREILEVLGMGIDQVYLRPVKDEIVAAIRKSNEPMSITHWSRVFEVDISYISKLVSRYGLADKVCRMKMVSPQG